MKLLKKLHISIEVKRLWLYYFLYCVIFIFLNLAMVSVFSFFHFLLNHDMNTIENWLNRNNWEILSLGKLFSLYFTSRIIKLNQYNEIKFRDFFIGLSYLPSRKMIGMIVFLLTIFYAFIVQFGGGVNQNQFKEELFYSSFIGSFIFYLADFVMIYLILKVFEVKKEDYSKVIYPCLILFLIASKIALPYLNKFYVFLMIHFLSLFVISFRGKLADVFLYGLLVIAPLSTIYGLDIVWDNAYSFFSYQKPLPALGILGIWGLALGYYNYSHAD